MVGLDRIELIWDTNTTVVLTAIAMRIITMRMSMINEMTMVGLDGIELIWDTNTIAVLTAIAMRIITMIMRM